MKPKWKHAVLFNGVMSMWYCEEYKIEITRDYRNNLNSDPTYPYEVNINRDHHGRYRLLSVAKKDAIIFVQQIEQNKKENK